MRKISVLGSPSYDLKMFLLELAWVLSKNNSVLCYIDTEFYDRFGMDESSETSLGGLTLIKNYKEGKEDEEADILISDALFEDCDTLIYVIHQSPFSCLFLESFVDLNLNCHKILVYLNFIDSPFDEDYFRKYQLNKKLLENIDLEEVLYFDEEVQRRQLENMLNKSISLKYYPKKYKLNLLHIASELDVGHTYNFKELYKDLDKRMAIC